MPTVICSGWDEYAAVINCDRKRRSMPPLTTYQIDTIKPALGRPEVLRADYLQWQACAICNPVLEIT